LTFGLPSRADKDYAVHLHPDEMPTYWGNLRAELPEPLPPPLDPATLEPASMDMLNRLFVKELVRLETTNERTIKIPDEVIDGYLRLPRPTPLVRAKRLEEHLKTPAEIYYKAEQFAPPGAFKANVSIPAAYYNMKEGAERLITLTGAGQWGAALAMSCAQYGMKCTVYMVKVSYLAKPGRRIMIETWGAEVFPSPSMRTKVGRAILEKDPNYAGSMGVAVSEGLEDALSDEKARYCTGSLWNYTLVNQSIMGLETEKQMQMIDKYPDIVLGCIGGGSNFAGMSYPFMRDKLKGKAETEFIAIESKAIPSTTRGVYTYDHGDYAGYTPLMKMYTLGHTYENPPIHAGGLRHHGKSPLLSYLINKGYMRSVAYHQTEVFEAARIFAQTEGVIPAPETAHSIKCVIDEAMKCKQKNEKKVIVFALTGHGLLDLTAYDAFLSGKLIDWEPSEIHVPQFVKDQV
jgi:tryptophan synthase beta chain